MAQTSAKKSARVPAPRGKPTTKKAAAAPAIARTSEMSQDVLKSVENGQRAALEAVRKFVDRIDEVLPDIGGSARRRETVVDAALELADRLVTTQYEFLHSVVRDASRAFTEATKK